MKSTITSKGQLTLPKLIRKKLNLQTGDKIEFIMDDSGVVRLIPQKNSITILKGIVKKPVKPVSLADMDEAIVEEGGSL